MNRKGHAMLELALASGVMLSALAGTVQFGYSFYAYNQVLTAVGNGARYASSRTLRAEAEKAKQAVRNMVVFGDPHPSSGARPLIPGLLPEHVVVEYTPESQPTAVRISVQNFKVNAIFGAMALDGRPAIEFPFLGKYAPEEHEP